MLVLTRYKLLQEASELLPKMFSSCPSVRNALKRFVRSGMNWNYFAVRRLTMRQYGISW